MAAPLSTHSMPISNAGEAVAGREARPGRRRPRMTHTTGSAERALSPADIAIRVAIVGLTLSTAYIHSTLGGLLFPLNALGYLPPAAAMVIPLPLAARYRWVVRLGLIGYAATTIIGWAIQGPYFMTAYIAKAIEVTLIVLVAVDFARMDGNTVTLVKTEIASLQARFGRRAATSSSNA